MENLAIWDQVKTPDPQYTKQFNRGGGFKGTSTNTQYAVLVATKLWGPNGIGWGLDITQEQYVNGALILVEDDKTKEKTNMGNEIIHVLQGNLWYMHDGVKYKTSPQYGQTTFVGKNKYGVFTDEEAPKKSVSDLMLKCMSLLGFSADIFLGLWDDNKYVNDVKKRFAEKKNPEVKNATVSDFEIEADSHANSVAELGEWYISKKAEIAKMKPLEQKQINTYVSNLKDALTGKESEN